MNDHNKTNVLESDNGKCEICPNREKRLAANEFLFPAFFRNSAQATRTNEPVTCRDYKVDLSGLFGEESYSGRPTFEPVFKKPVAAKKKNSAS